MSSLLKLMAASGGVAAQTYVDDVFAITTRTGNGGTSVITTGIDLATKGGFVWTKERTDGGLGNTNNILMDTLNGNGTAMRSNLNIGLQTVAGKFLSAVSSTGYSVIDDASATYGVNGGGGTPPTYVDWEFAQAAGFCKVVRWTGNGANRTIAHGLGAVPGLIMVARTDGTTADWKVYHRSLANTDYLVLNTNAASATGATVWNSTTADATSFSLGTHADVNANGGSYIAYVFGHDTSATGIVQCGTFTTDGSGNATVTLGWEPQFLKIKANAAAHHWIIGDTARGMSQTALKLLEPDANSGDISVTGIIPTATGFVGNSNILDNSTQYYYMAIRRPNKPPTAGTQVYNAIARTGTGAAVTVTGVGFAPDVILARRRDNGGFGYFGSRLIGPNKSLSVSGSGLESSFTTGVLSYDMDGVHEGDSSDVGDLNSGTIGIINWFLKRAPGVFDEVCYKGTGANTTVSHNLTVVPELIFVKNRGSSGGAWNTYCAQLANTQKLILNTTAAVSTDATAWNSTTPTTTVFSLGTQAAVNTNNDTYVARLFATLAGISKVGSYTGNGTSQTIACGFAAGARFILIKRTDNTGNWYVWDTVRGIVAGNDPYLALNDPTITEVTTDDSIDPDSTGFIVNQVAASNINVNAATYIFLAFA